MHAAPYLQLCVARLAPGVESQELGDALMLVGADALYYSPPLTLRALGVAGALPRVLPALLASAFAAKKSGARHVGGWGGAGRGGVGGASWV